ncbi:MAG: plasmid pRiA4b ORF-3 family protein [Cyanobacteria bacterium P01_F01_bin.53]
MCTQEAKAGGATATSSAATSSAPKKKAVRASPNTLYVLLVAIIDGPVTEAFIAQNPEVSRTIEIKGSNTLKDLHNILFSAFDREENHMYEFQIGGRGPHDPNATTYGIKIPSEPTSDKDVAKAKIATLGLSEGDAFGYGFDFGDDWWHQVNVLEIKEKAPKGKYPKVTKRIGASPPQYADFE